MLGSAHVCPMYNYYCVTFHLDARYHGNGIYRVLIWSPEVGEELP